MVVGQRYNIIDPAKGLLDRSIFVDEQTYQDELERVFGRAWLFIGHESQIPNPNDFFLTYMGEDPVILTRDGKGEVHAFLNMCRHRGNRIVRADDGNAKNFMCAYHGWTYSNDGKLVSVPGLQEAYYGELDVDNLGLVPVAHLDTYAGFVLATWAEDAPTLKAYLGDMRWYLDMTFARLASGVELIGPEKWVGPFNWKVSTDNFIGDQYHAPLSHRSAMLAQQRVRGGGVVTSPYMNYTQPGYQISPGNGHGIGVHWREEGSVPTFQTEQDARSRWDAQMLPRVEERLGTLRTKRLMQGNASVFPNMSYLANGTVRLWHPRGPARTEIWSWTFIEREAPQEVRRLKRLGAMSFGAGGTFEQDDMDNWRQTTASGLMTIGRKYASRIHMGLSHEETHAELPGRVIPRLCGEINQRSMYSRWQEFMNAESWAAISIDPITVKFEGTASTRD